jgi:putative serine protease PepD
VTQIANEILSGQNVQHAYVGVCLSGSTTGGALIATTGDQQCQSPISPGSPAAAAGLRAGDLITAIDNQAVRSTDDFIAIINNDKPGQTVTMTVRRSGETLDIKVKLGTRPAKTPNGG